ncbi:hypothetical protein CI109_104362 [Kwoniella shandongensis]|uniref:Cullin family profile domain-containing protein n=1 Tax=Kwoniella shandongensis TaxID=1734106 RepID=A0A5M6BX59_9TREE|nr:uncharacterized protein CI109_004240 [Kwoniella shandongensis]KAA5527424.1 hypothetical protein CI109_004240 [Kwoniella shandongensis]
MTSLILLPSQSDAFSAYQPSKNAHVDILHPTTLGKKRDPSGSGKEGVKTIRLSLPAQPAPPPVKDQLNTLLSAVAPLLSGQQTAHSYHHLSSICHTLVLQPHTLGPTIYTRVKEELEKSTAGLAREWRGGIMAREKGWLSTLVQGWKAFEGRVSLLSAVFVYLDRVYSNSSNGITSIRELSIATFKKFIWENEILAEKTRDEVLAWVTAEREAGSPSTDVRPTISSVSALAKLLSTFSTLSEPFVDLTTSYYQSSSMSYVDSVEQGGMSATKYVEWVLEKVDEEKERGEACLSIEVAERVVQVVRREAGEEKGTKIIQRALDEAMDNADSPALARLYQLSVDVNVFPLFFRALQDHLEARLKTIISDPANDPHMIDGTLKLKRFADKAVADLFPAVIADVGEVDKEESEKAREEKEALEKKRTERTREFELEEAIRTGFKLGMGSRQNAPAEWIAKHLDVAMRKGQGSGTEAEFNTHLDEIIALIGFTKDKDVFKAFYSSQLAKRLLLSKSASDDMERNMIVKLQKEMGEEFTTGDVMMKDLQLSETLVKAYQSAQAKNPEQFKESGNFTANVLTESAWPAYPLLKDGWNFQLTPDLQSSVDAFTSWYSTQHKNRQLSWRFQLATVTLTGRFPSGKYEIGVSLFQAVVMLQFNEVDTLTFKELKDRTGIEAQELIRTVQSLALGRKGTRVLLKKPPGKEINPTDVFAWNKGFTSDRIKFKINQIQQDMSAEESRKTNEQVAVDRVSVLEATIVRIMKARKKLTLQLLIDAVVSDVVKRFPPDVKEIKKRVESLIEREFLMRDEEERGVLHYLA